MLWMVWLCISRYHSTDPITISKKSKAPIQRRQPGQMLWLAHPFSANMGANVRINPIASADRGIRAFADQITAGGSRASLPIAPADEQRQHRGDNLRGQAEQARGCGKPGPGRGQRPPEQGNADQRLKQHQQNQKP